MTISTTTRLVTYTGNGSTTNFAYAFLIPDAASVEVALYDATTNLLSSVLATTAYTINGLGNPSGGTIDYPLTGSPLTSTFKLVIKRVVPFTQDTDILNQGGFNAEVIEDQLDAIVMMIQQNGEDVGRALRVSPTLPATDAEDLATSLNILAPIVDDLSTLAAAVTDGALLPANNLDDVNSAATARTNLDVQEDVVTTRGDIVRGSSGAIAERLALGATKSILRSDGADVAWVTPAADGDILTGAGWSVTAGDRLPKAGEVMIWPGLEGDIPTGRLVADGSSVSRATYADLFAAIGVIYGNVDGNTFNLPDYQGEFLRGVDSGEGNDPDAAGRTDRGDGTDGDNVGTKQLHALQNHDHDYNNYPMGANADSGAAQGPILTARKTGGANTSGAYSPLVSTGETRARNVGVFFLIVT